MGVGDSEPVVRGALREVTGAPARVDAHDVDLQVGLGVEPYLAHLLADTGVPVPLVVRVA